MNTDIFKKVVDVNLVGTFIVTKLAVEAMRDNTPLKKVRGGREREGKERGKGKEREGKCSRCGFSWNFYCHKIGCGGNER